MSYIPKFGRLWVTPQIRRRNKSIYASLRCKALSFQQFISVQTVGKRCRSRGQRWLSANVYDFFVGVSTNVSRLPLDSSTTLSAATRVQTLILQLIVRIQERSFGPAHPDESFPILQSPTFATVVIVDDVCIVESHSSGASLPKKLLNSAVLPFSRLTLLSDQVLGAIWLAGRFGIAPEDFR